MVLLLGLSIRNIFWSGNNYELPEAPADIGTEIVYRYGSDEKRDRRGNIRFISRYFPQIQMHEFPCMAHAELVMIHPKDFCRYAESFLPGQTESEE